MLTVKNTVILILSALILIILSFFAGRLTTEPVEKIKYINKDTTIIKEIPSDPIIIQAKGKISYRDTGSTKYILVRHFIDTCKPFTVALDTILKRDTLNVKYDYPINNFSILFRRHPDSITTRTITIMNDPPKETKLDGFVYWLAEAGKIIGSGLIGFGIGRAK